MPDDIGLAEILSLLVVVFIIVFAAVYAAAASWEEHRRNVRDKRTTIWDHWKRAKTNAND